MLALVVSPRKLARDILPNEIFPHLLSIGLPVPGAERGVASGSPQFTRQLKTNHL
jgi:hypothetical protein